MANVTDSLLDLFVLGRRAIANQIRLKKLSELIHKSADHPNLKDSIAIAIVIMTAIATPGTRPLLRMHAQRRWDDDEATKVK